MSDHIEVISNIYRVFSSQPQLDLLKTDCEKQVLEKQCRETGLQWTQLQENLVVADVVIVKIHCQNCVTWQPGTIVEKPGPVSYIVSLDSGSRQKCYANQIRKREVLTESSANTQLSASSNSVDTTSELNDDNAIEILPPVVLHKALPVLLFHLPILKPTQLLQHPILLSHLHSIHIILT